MFYAAICAYQAADSERADELWEKVRAIWPQAWSANYAVSSQGSPWAGISKPAGRSRGRTVESREILVVEVIALHAHADVSVYYIGAETASEG